MKTEMSITSSAASEVMKLIHEHLAEGGPFNDDLLLSVHEALGEADRIVIIPDHDLTALEAQSEDN